MANKTRIEWTDHTFNPWIGCEKVSEGCKFCYAECSTPARVSTHRGLPLWGGNAHRQVTSEGNWKLPLRWNKEAGRYPDRCTKCGRRLCMAAQNQMGTTTCPSRRNPDGTFDPSYPPCGGSVELDDKPRVFCASLADVFERYEGPAMDAVWAARARLFLLIGDTHNLIWQLLTKRPENIMEQVPPSWRAAWPRNVWIGCTVENQKRADERLPHLLRVPAPVRFVSYEPALEAVDFTRILLKKSEDLGPDITFDALKGWYGGALDGRTRVDWLIAGGESGPGARPCAIEWIESARDQCAAAGVAFFAKQLGALVMGRNCEHGRAGQACKFKDRKGGDWSEWPEDLRVREFPAVRKAE